MFFCHLLARGSGLVFMCIYLQLEFYWIYVVAARDCDWEHTNDCGKAGANFCKPNEMENIFFVKMNNGHVLALEIFQPNEGTPLPTFFRKYIHNANALSALSKPAPQIPTKQKERRMCERDREKKASRARETKRTNDENGNKKTNYQQKMCELLCIYHS